MSDQPTATKSEVEDAQKRVAEKRAKLRATARQKRSDLKPVERGKTLARLEQEEATLDAQLAAAERGGVTNPLPAPPKPPKGETKTDNAPKGDDSKDGDS